MGYMFRLLFESSSGLQDAEPDIQTFIALWDPQRVQKDVIYICIYTGCPRRNVPNFGRVFLMLKYTDITQNTYIQS